MSNVVKMVAKKNKLPIEDWKDEIEEHAKKLMDRLYDQIRLADNDVSDADIPEEFAVCMILGVLTSMLVTIAHARNILSPAQLLTLVKYEIEGRQEEE
jgi:hypothetical protein